MHLVENTTDTSLCQVERNLSNTIASVRGATNDETHTR